MLLAFNDPTCSWSRARNDLIIATPSLLFTIERADSRFSFDVFVTAKIMFFFFRRVNLSLVWLQFVPVFGISLSVFVYRPDVDEAY